MSGSLDALTGENLFRDPYPVYARLRREAPVSLFQETGEWFVTRWSDCQTIGVKDALFGPSDSSGRPEARVMGMPNVLSMSGPEHACLRQGIDENLSAEKVNGYIERLARPIVNRFIKSIRERGAADLTTELFEPISVRIIGDFVGFTEVDVDTLTRWFHSLNGGLQRPNDPDAWAACERARNEIDDVMRPIVERVTSKPDHSLTSHVVHGGMAEGKVRGFDEIMPTMRVIVLGGLQEPGHGAANATFGLLQDPAQAVALTVDPAGLAQRAYDEGLRWIAPIGVTPRLAREEFELAGTVIPKGASVAIVLASANRDESRFEDADRFVLDRPRKQHASFGYRPHFCSGHYLSRSIGKIALEEAFSSLPNLRLDPDREVVSKGWRFRGVMNLPAVWDA
ncbi:cytochrome P450 [Mesorhizobium onobrychidis]|uniref:Cytochrome P450 n=1 Tax=Mesorhizobium onobrychidis TaxID=2775404 RepID=A0ABY5QV47_9HYPH|nr:cytochrome P450 [Mesorhizobium onobrychidis]UVC15045.1 cytochrome P450 [Mesorhizobium onobrychidis]